MKLQFVFSTGRLSELVLHLSASELRQATPRWKPFSLKTAAVAARSITRRSSGPAYGIRLLKDLQTVQRLFTAIRFPFASV